MSNLWYPKCIHIYGCEIDYEVIFPLFLHNEKYIKKGVLTEDFYDDLSIGGIFINNNYELRRYKISMDPQIESYFLILNKIVVDITTIGNTKVEINPPNENDLNNFKKFISNYQLEYKQYIVITG